MPRYSSAYTDFTHRITEVDKLRSLAAAHLRQSMQRNAETANTLCRGAVVLLSSHLEGYVRSLGELTLDRIHQNSADRKTLSNRVFYHVSRDLIEEIKNTADQEKIAVKLFKFVDRDVGMWARSGHFPTAIQQNRFCKGFSNPSFEKIKSFLGRFGYTTYKLDMERRLQRNFLAYRNMVDNIVDVRNKIAHGDADANKTPVEIKEMITLTRRFCAETDTVFGGWCRKNICSIR